MEHTIDYTTEELTFKKLHKELLNLEQYDLATKLSKVFHEHGHEQYKKGAKMVEDIRDRK